MKTVNLFDTDRGTTFRIPAAELAPGHILAHRQGVKDPAYVDMSKLHISRTPVYAAVPPEAERALRYYHATVAQVDPLPYSEHQFLLCCNQHPVRELTILCHIARIYHLFAKVKVVNGFARQQLFLFLQQCSMAEKDTVLHVAVPLPGILHLASQIVEAFYNSDPREEFSKQFDPAKMNFPPVAT